MILFGTLVNMLTVLAGATVGMLLGKRLPLHLTNLVFQALGLFTIVLGVQMALVMNQPLIVVFSLVIGSLIGARFCIDKRIEGLSDKIRQRWSLGADNFTEGLVVSFLLFCVGSMTIVGSINEGLGLGSKLLLTKAVMDFFSAMLFAGKYGSAVHFSVVPMLIFQGGLTLLAYWVGSVVPGEVIDELSATGGIMMIGLGLSILDIKKIPVVNMIPSLLLAALLTLIYLKLQITII